MTIIEQILADLPFTVAELGSLIRTAPQRYKTHFIEKRNNRGRRLISQPTAEIKLIQRWALTKVLVTLPVHGAAKAYVRGRGIGDHAAPHKDAKYLLKLDFKDFFPSIKSTDFIQHIRAFSSLDHEDAEVLARILFYRHPQLSGLRLSIGAPSSPAVSNTIMFPFDQRIEAFCQSHGLNYSRYADDLALSTNVPHLLDRAHEFVATTCRKMTHPRLVLNDEKTVFSSKKFSRRLTGLVLTNDGTVSLGREKKRLMRAMAHRFSLGQLNVEEVAHLRGLIAFAYSVEPGFVDRLRSTVGVDKMTFLFPIGGTS